MSRLGGIMYGRLTEGIELARPVWKEELAKDNGLKELAKPKVDGQ